MIITRTPFRVSFIGGGTDFEGYYRPHGGQVISASIDKYIYVTVNHKFDKRIHLRYSEIECVDCVADLKHNIAREALLMAGVEDSVEIAIISDVPTQGSGLGSSSSLSVGLLHALSTYKGIRRTPVDLAKMACSLEIDNLKSPIGKQDQYAAAIGGFNLISFNFHDKEAIIFDRIEDKHVNKRRLCWLKESAMLFYINGRSSNGILVGHKNSIDSKLDVLHRQKMLVNPFLEWLCGKHDNKFLGELINASWELKKQMTPAATSGWIDSIVDNATKSGALGVKLCGAGGGGFMLVICDVSHQKEVRESLGLLEMKFSFGSEGSKVIHHGD